MKRRNQKYLIAVFFMAAALALAGCVKENPSSADKEATAIRVQTTIRMDFSGSRSSTRAAGTHTEGDYIQGTDPGSAHDIKVTTIRVLAFDGSGNKKVNILFGNSGTDGIDKTFVLKDGKYEMDMKMLAGAYQFYLIANEEANWGLSAINTLSGLQDNAVMRNFTNPITTIAELTASKGIPMIGFNNLTIPAAGNTTENNPAVINPVIDLKRTISKVEVRLTNIDPSTGAVYVKASNYTIKSVGLYNMNQRYHVLDGISAAVSETNQNVLNNITHTAGAPFTLQNILTAYMAERRNVTESNATHVIITVAKPGDDAVTYNIPIYQKNADASLNYNMLRNTLYRLNCYLNGSEMPYIEVFYSVGDWDLVTSATLMGYGYNVDVVGNNVTISNTVEACKPHEVKLVALNGAKFSDDTTEKIFGSQTAETHTDYAATAKTNYTLKDVPLSDDYLAVYYNGTLVKTFKK